MTGKWSHKFTR